MKKLLFTGIAVSMLAACSNDEVVPVNNESNAIKFGVKTEGNTRAADIYCSTHAFTKFNVYAEFNDLKYIDGDLIENVDPTGKASWDNKSGLRYWPDGDVTFYGYVNGTPTWNDYKSAPRFVNFTVNNNITGVENADATVEGQVDLMYATKTQSKKTNSQVTLNFRHALSQIVFNAKNTNKNLYVEIEEVAIKNVYGKGTYTLPMVDTDETLTHPNAVGNEKTGSRGSWALAENSNNAEYRVAVKNAENKSCAVLEGDDSEEGTLVDLTTYDGESKDNFSRAMLLLPSKKTDDENSDYVTNLGLKAAPYFLVKCRIYNVAEVDAEDLTNNVVLWGKTNADGTVEAKDIMIPFDPYWDEGKKYTYTFTFGKGNGGYDPDPEEPKPVLVPITFNVTIDEFINVTPSINVPMVKPE